MDIQSLFDVKGKVVLITGGAKGIGRMISEGFVANGARVYIASRDARACEQAAAELNATYPSGPGSAIALPADLSFAEECVRLAGELEKRLEGEGLNVLVHNSGATWGESFDEYPDAGWTKVLTLNLQRVFTLTQALTPLLERGCSSYPSALSPSPSSSSPLSSSSSSSPEAETGEKVIDPARVIHIGSIDALRVSVLSNFAYSASKAGLHHLSRVLAAHLGPRGIASNTLACGPFPTRMMAAPLGDFGDEVRGAVPLGSRVGTPQDIAGACLFLASRAGAFVTGATVALDGGMSLMAKM